MALGRNQSQLCPRCLKGAQMFLSDLSSHPPFPRDQLTPFAPRPPGWGFLCNHLQHVDLQ